MKGGHRKEMGAGERKGLGLFAFVSVIFFTVSGGAYGLESLVGAVGPAWAVLLVLVTPFLWALPISMMVAELATAMPEEGGYYIWVRRALGPFWGMQAGWWIICYSVVDMAIYPVLFVNYLGYFRPFPDGPSGMLVRCSIAAGVIAASLAVNWRGARAVGTTSLFNALLVLLPFGVMTAVGLSGCASSSAFAGPHTAAWGGPGLIALGLSTVLWNYCGFDNISTFAGEVAGPERTYPRAMAVALPLIALTYLLPLLTGLAVATDPGLWSESAGWPVIAGKIGGDWLGILVAAAALCSAYSQFNSQLLYVSRLPYAMARDGWLPAPLARTSRQTGVPLTALAACCAVAALFAALPFGKLVILDILLYSASLSLQFAALIALRRTEPHLHRPFRIPGGRPFLFLLMLVPMALAATVLAASLSGNGADPLQALILCAILASGIVIYFTRRTVGPRKTDA